jgi:long-subunit fatty acid transport protein
MSVQQSKYFGDVNGSSEFIHARLSPTISYQVTPKLAIGARLGLDYAWFDMNMPLGIAYLDLGRCDGYGYSGAVGVLYKPVKSLTIGAFYESDTFFEDLDSKKGDAYMKMNMAPFGGPIVEFSSITMSVNHLRCPQLWGAGLCWTPSPSWRLSLDTKFIKWDATFDKIRLEFNGKEGLPRTLDIPLGIQNQITACAGVEYFFGNNNRYTLGLGYHYADDGMRDKYMNPLLPGEGQHNICIGFTINVSESVSVGIAVEHTMIDDPSCSKSAYDMSIERQLGLPRGALDSELNNADCDYTANTAMISLLAKW